ncbi:MAG TPA: glutamate formimidoyltransferase [Bacteroidales bacterium]|jgi:glutamate formiminotransferase/formiminotetrahydrofolate cyclodeaminase|nr:glutamate formimidoyltransferase [Bacteroidales bacterium]
MHKQLIECVPNFSEGNDMNVIKQITDQIETVDGVRLIDVDPGKATNRTVVTFVGTPEEAINAAFLAIKKAAELIDMSKHKGAHPRFGATDVCPLVPVSNITMEETVKYAHKLAERVGKELGIPVYCYEFAAQEEKRKNLANCRSGEYEGLGEKLSNPDWKPDFGPALFNESVIKSGATAISARNFLIAYNINLNTTSTRRANAIAFDIREKGRVKREGGTLTGKIIKDENGNPVTEPGMLKCVKGIGWYIEEYGIAQLSFNLTDITVTSAYQVFEAACQRAEARGLRVTGSELVGVIPLKAMLDAGKYFLKKQKRSTGIADDEIIKIAVKSLGLDELGPFDPKKKIIEYILEDDSANKLVNMNLTAFANETASESPAPGGGSISAYMGALGVALGTMVANLSSHKRGWDERWEEFSDWADKGKSYLDQLNHMVDEDTIAFNKIMDAFGLPKKTGEEKAIRNQAIQNATKYAIEVPLKVMKLCYESMEVMKAMAEIGNPNSVSDAGVGALAARSGVLGAFLNVKINAGDFEDKGFVEKVLAEGRNIENNTIALEKEILAIVESKIS